MVWLHSLASKWKADLLVFDRRLFVQKTKESEEKKRQHFCGWAVSRNGFIKRKKKVTIWCVSENQHWGLTDVLRESAVLCLIPSTHGQFSGVHFRHQKVVLSKQPPLFRLKVVHLWF